MKSALPKPRKAESSHARRKISHVLALIAGVGIFSLTWGLSVQEDEPGVFQLPPNAVVEKVAGPPLIQYPLFICFDDEGRLYVAEGTGRNVSGPEVYPLKLGKITRLEDRDGDGVFETGHTFADELVLPQGVLWHDGAVYVASHPSIWRLEDTNGDGVADRREELIGKFAFNGNGNDIKGPFMGPDGWLYWTHGRHGYQINTSEGEYLEGMASRVWRSRIDGTQIERIAGGGFDNPVELIWTENGSLIGTMDQWEGDALLHYVLGGVYPQGKHPAVGEFPMTGRLLGQITSFSPAFPAALCGLVRLRTDHFGTQSQGSLISTHYNVKRLQQHFLRREGATYRSVNENFLVSTDIDFHPTDVLEDGDGSLLVLDMGAWFTYGCPTAGINPKADSRGVIYRLRSTDLAPVDDPWGKSLQLGGLSVPKLVSLLEDSRPRVRDRAGEELVNRGESAVSQLAALVSRDGQRAPGGAAVVEFRRNALWALSRIGTTEARVAIREALTDREASIRQVAAHCAGLERDEGALSVLSQVLVSDDAAFVQLKAAEALGRIGRSEAIPSLLQALTNELSDPFLEHALIYALIEIADPERTAVALRSASPRVRRAGVIALDQMKKEGQVSLGDGVPVNYETEVFLDGEQVKITSYKHVGGESLTVEDVAPLLDSQDPDLTEAALEVISQRDGWEERITSFAQSVLDRTDLTKAQRQSLVGAVMTFSDRPEIQQLVAGVLADRSKSAGIRSVLLEALVRMPSKPLPSNWIASLEEVLESNEAELQEGAIHVIHSHKLAEFDSRLQELSRRTDLSVQLRVAALRACSSRLDELSLASFDLLIESLTSTEPLVRIAAAEALGSARLSPDQLIRLADWIGKVGDEIVVPLLVPAYLGQDDAETGHTLVTALLQSSGTETLSTEVLERLLKAFPATVQNAAQPLYEKRSADHREERAEMTRLLTELQVSQGDRARGEELFFSRRAGCSSCHSIGGRGGMVGPELSDLKTRRGIRGTLEKLVFPHNTIVPSYRVYTIEAEPTGTVTGLIAGESSGALFIRTPRLEEIRIDKSEIKSVRASQTSLMPDGVDKRLQPAEMNDLLEFLLAN